MQHVQRQQEVPSESRKHKKKKKKAQNRCVISCLLRLSSFALEGENKKKDKAMADGCLHRRRKKTTQSLLSPHSHLTARPSQVTRSRISFLSAASSTVGRVSFEDTAPLLRVSPGEGRGRGFFFFLVIFFSLRILYIKLSSTLYLHLEARRQAKGWQIERSSFSPVVKR